MSNSWISVPTPDLEADVRVGTQRGRALSGWVMVKCSYAGNEADQAGNSPLSLGRAIHSTSQVTPAKAQQLIRQA